MRSPGDKSYPLAHAPRLTIVKGDFHDPNSIRVYRESPETVGFQIRMKGRYVHVSLPFELAKEIGWHLRAAGDLTFDITSC